MDFIAHRICIHLCLAVYIVSLSILGMNGFHSTDFVLTNYSTIKNLLSFHVHPVNFIQFIFKDVHRRQKLTTDFFQTFRVVYFRCEYLNFEKKNAYRGFQGVIF